VAVKFLTEEWASAMTDALNSSDEFKSAAGSQQVKLQQVVTDTPDGARRSTTSRSRTAPRTWHWAS